MTKLLVLLIATVFACMFTYSQQVSALIPLPVEMKETNEAFVINTKTVLIDEANAAGGALRLFNEYIHPYTLTPLRFALSAPVKNFIALKIDSASIKQTEGYALSVTNKRITLTAHDAAGILHGIQTLRQLWRVNKGSVLVPGCTVTDYPWFTHRSMALDVSRHFFPVSFIKKYVDVLALYKFNTFHWHLTDDQGWRIEIKRYRGEQPVRSVSTNFLNYH